MTPLPTLLRDSCFAALAFVAAGEVAGHGLSVAAGALAGVLNLGGLAITVTGSPGALYGRLALHNISALVALAVLLTRFEPLPAMIGLLAPLVAIALRTLAAPPSSQLPAVPSPTGAER